MKQQRQAKRSGKYGNETRTLQVWPGGASFSYQGDPDGPAEQRRLRSGYHDPKQRWRRGTADEWRRIRIELRAEIYGNRDVLGCDSSLVDDLIKAAGSGELTGDLASGFGYDEIRGMYKDPSDWDAGTCREYASDHGVDLPEDPADTCQHCNEAIEQKAPDADWVHQDTGSGVCPSGDNAGKHNPAGDAEPYEDDTRHGWLGEAREACREHTQDNPAEVYEWWRVSSWLCGQLAEIGEVTIDNGYGHWWGRTCTGQGWIMDGTLQEVAAKFEREEVSQ